MSKKDKEKDKGPAKTNAARLLEQAHIPFQLVSYPVDEDHLEATHVAESLGEDIRQVFKTIVMHGDRVGHFVCVVPGDAEIDLKKAARVAGDKKVDLIAVRDLLPLTGYIRGGCSPVGMKKTFPTYIHTTATQFPFIFVSAGVRGLQLRISPADLIAYTRATVAPLVAGDDTVENGKEERQ